MMIIFMYVRIYTLFKYLLYLKVKAKNPNNKKTKKNVNGKTFIDILCNNIIVCIYNNLTFAWYNIIFKIE
jgi:hypothetical protein